MVTATYLRRRRKSAAPESTRSFFSGNKEEPFFKPASTAESGAQSARGNDTGAAQVEKEQAQKMSPKDRATFIKENCIGFAPDPDKTECSFDSYQETVIRVAKDHAIRMCDRALLALDMSKKEEVDYLVSLIFHVDHIPFDFIRTAIIAVRNQLEKIPILCKTCYDEACSIALDIAYTTGNHSFIGICPVFFSKNNLPETPRFLIHESGHLANLDQGSKFKNSLEHYCTMEEKFNYWTKPCPLTDDIMRNVDAWSFLIDRLSNEG